MLLLSPVNDNTRRVTGTCGLFPCASSITDDIVFEEPGVSACEVPRPSHPHAQARDDKEQLRKHHECGLRCSPIQIHADP